MDQLTVTFQAGSAGTFPLTWAQLDFWRKKIKVFGDLGRNFNIPLVLDLPGPVGLAEFTAVLRRLVERNQVLRTCFRDSPSGPVQVVAGSGAFVLRCYESPADGSRARADAVAAELKGPCFSHETEWGIRLAVVCVDGAPRHLAFAVSHLMIDGSGLQALVEELFALLATRAAGEPEPPLRWQPAEQAAREQTDRSARRNRAALAHWRKHLTAIPPTMFPAPPRPFTGPRFGRVRLESAALAATAPRLAASCQVPVSSVLMGAFAVALGLATGQPSCELILVVGNRYDQAFRSMVGAAAQDCLLTVNLTGQVTDVVRATHKAAMAAYYYGYYDPAAVEDLTAAIAAERGIRFDLNCIYNDLSAFTNGSSDDPTVRPAGRSLTEDTVRALLAQTSAEFMETWEGQSCKVYLAAEPGAESCALDLVADTAHLPRAALKPLLLGAERIVLEAAYRADLPVGDVPALTGLTPPAA